MDKLLPSYLQKLRLVFQFQTRSSEGGREGSEGQRGGGLTSPIFYTCK